MVALSDVLTLTNRETVQFRVVAAVNLYDSPECKSLATQADCDRQLRFMDVPHPEQSAIRVELVEDDYPGWLALDDLSQLEAAANDYACCRLEREAIAPKLPTIIAFMEAAMAVPNEYLWGGTVAPNYDCSGLMQAAFWSEGVWLPRDAYQQEGFLEAIAVGIESDRVNCDPLQPGDLVFFGTPEKATHVGLYLGEGRYIHSSGKDMGRNGIAVDELRGDEAAHPISRGYFKQFRGAGRVMQSYVAKA